MIILRITPKPYLQNNRNWILAIHKTPDKIIIFLKLVITSLMFITLFVNVLKANTIYENSNTKDSVTFKYDEFDAMILLEANRNFNLDVIYTSNKLLFVNIEELFNTLGITCNQNQNDNSLVGFINLENNTYIIDFDTKQIKIKGKEFTDTNSLLKISGSHYIESSLLAKAFEIHLDFNFRSLTISLKSDFELPITKDIRTEKLRSNISKLKNEGIADTTIKRFYHLFNYGMIDWSVSSFQSTYGMPGNQFGIGIGTEFMYGETDIFINYFDSQNFDFRQIRYLWHWVDNDKYLIKQADAGIISHPTIAFLNSILIGTAIRNSPSTVRNAKGYYTINEYTQPNWTVELYINNVLVDFTKADARGLFIFKVPNIYGYSIIKLVFYGTSGEVRTEERTRNVPYTVIPEKEFEYSLIAGILQNKELARFGKLEFNYGATDFLTISAGSEYLSSIPNQKFIPYTKATFQPLSNLTISGEYDYGVKYHSLINYYLWKEALLEFDYTKYNEGQKATFYNANEERRIKLSVPMNFENISIFTRLDYNQLVYKDYIFNQANILISTYYKQISTHSTSQIYWVNKNQTYFTTLFLLSYRFANGYNFTPSIQYNITENKPISYKIQAEKSIIDGYISLTFERNITFKANLFSLNLKYNFPFTRTSAFLTQENKNYSSTENIEGSIALSSGNNYINLSNNTSVSKGGILLYPFLDKNFNGIYDDDEYLVKINTLKILSGKVIYSEYDSIVRITDLNSFTNYKIEFSDNNLDNIAWRFKHNTYQVMIDPNQFKRIDIPVVIVGEANGMVLMNRDNNLKGIGRITVHFYKKNNSNIIATTLSEGDGYVYYMGLEPGEYIARLDTEQLSKLDFNVEPKEINFTIKTNEEGDIYDGINFILSKKITLKKK